MPTSFPASLYLYQKRRTKRCRLSHPATLKRNDVALELAIPFPTKQNNVISFYSQPNGITPFHPILTAVSPHLSFLPTENCDHNTQVNSAVSHPALFALCTSGSPSAPGVEFFNTPGPYSFLPGINLSKSLNYTPLLEVSDGGGTVTPYYIGIPAIKVNGKPLEFNSTILAVDRKGYGGTKINTVHPYTVLHTTIFKACVQAFVNESAAMNLTVTKPVKPFSLCFPADDVLETQLGPAVPPVDLVMHSDDVFWRMFGSNSLVRIASDETDAWCLGFVDGGIRPRASIVIGARQMEDNLLQFYLGMRRLGFSSSVLVHNTMCANFNFTTNNNLKPL